ncbi:hypothetical protein BT63DRAFT_23275 [Microthyrium microscopicum]|uniref:Uncharacterized protein n=1 Tax=Microthyrium microscopicum TaxID=703497 RepID=A0A6A6URM0_9PEZI|nr:hypothetical protein BT63DRAFT_23275 [Microthyrium microscopicum]
MPFRLDQWRARRGSLRWYSFWLSIGFLAVSLSISILALFLRAVVAVEIFDKSCPPLNLIARQNEEYTCRPRHLLVWETCSRIVHTAITLTYRGCLRACGVSATSPSSWLTTFMTWIVPLMGLLGSLRAAHFTKLDLSDSLKNRIQANVSKPIIWWPLTEPRKVLNRGGTPFYWHCKSNKRIFLFFTCVDLFLLLKIILQRSRMSLIK